MKLKQLSYSVQKEHTIPYLPHVFYTVTFLLLCILIPINVALAGSDVVTTLRRDPNSVEKPWWAPSFWPKALTLRVPDICQPQSINDDPTLRTNSTAPIFKYALRSASGPGGESKDPSQRMYPVPYMANPLSDCKVENIIWRVTVPIRAMSYKVTVNCKLVGQKEFGNIRVPDNIKLSTIHYRIRNNDLGLDDMKEYLSFNLSPGQSDLDSATGTPLETLGSLPADPASPNNIIAVLDGMQTDLYHAIWTQLNLWVLRNVERRDTYVIEWFAGAEDKCQDRLAPANEAPISCGNAADPNRITRWYGTTNDWGSVTGTASFLRPFNTSIINMMIALQDAITIDLGSADPASNIFLNKTYFSQVIKLDPFHKASEASMLNTTDNWNLSSEGYWNFCSSWSCIPTSWAQALRDASEGAPVQNIMLPYKPSSQAPSVFSFSYLCPTFKPKAINSLLLSVFVATASTLSALYALFCYVMPWAEEKYQRRKRTMNGAINADPDKQEEHPLVRGAELRSPSKMPYDSPLLDMNRYWGHDYVCAPMKTAYEPGTGSSYDYSVTEYHHRR